MKNMNPKNFFTAEERERLVTAIQAAEKMTSGEIRVHLHDKCKLDPEVEARQAFEKLGMTKTREKNGILFFLSTQDHHFVILGDRGIDQKVKSNFWDNIRDEMLPLFSQKKFCEALELGIFHCGEKLKEFFPYHPEDKNELSNDLSFS